MFSEGKIQLDSPHGTYYAGQTLFGAVEFTQRSSRSMRGIYIHFKGVAKVQWKAGKSSYSGREEYINSKMYLMGAESENCELPPGIYKLPFQFVIPVQAPSSFETIHGRIRYKLKAGLDLPLQFDPTIKLLVTVVAPLNLNLIPQCLKPLNLNVRDTYWDCCCGDGSAAEVVARLPRAGYCPSQSLPLHVHCDNATTIDILNVKVAVKKTITLRSGSGEISWTTMTKRESRTTVAEVMLGPVPGCSQRDWRVDLLLPADLALYNLDNCRIIDVDFVLKVHIIAAGCHKGNSGEQKLYVGSIPIAEASAVDDNVAYSGEPSAPLLENSGTDPPPDYVQTRPINILYSKDN